MLCRTAFIRVCCKINLARFRKTGLAKILSFLSTSLVLACLLCCLVMSFLGCFAVRDLFRSGCRQNVANFYGWMQQPG